MMCDMGEKWAITILAWKLMQPNFMKVPFQAICYKNTYRESKHIGHFFLITI